MSASSSWLQALPSDFYNQLAHCLSLHGMATAELLSHPEATHLTHLTALNSRKVQQLNSISTQPELLAALEAEPLDLYQLLLLGRLTLETSMAVPVLGYVKQHMQIDEQQLDYLKTYCLELSGAFLSTLEEHITAPAGIASLGLHRLHIEEAFTKLLAAHAATTPTPAANLRLSEPQLQMLRLALLLVHSLPTTADHPFIKAVGKLPNLQPQALEPLIEHLGRVRAQEQLTLTMPELVQLYQGMQVCGMIFVSDVMTKIGLEEAFPTLTADEINSTEAAPVSNRQAVGEMVSGFTQWVQHTFPDSEEIQEAKKQVLTLADAL